VISAKGAPRYLLRE
jgi:hypothetical protein